jgi:hypothetical protein
MRSKRQALAANGRQFRLFRPFEALSFCDRLPATGSGGRGAVIDSAGAASRRHTCTCGPLTSTACSRSRAGASHARLRPRSAGSTYRARAREAGDRGRGCVRSLPPHALDRASGPERRSPGLRGFAEPSSGLEPETPPYHALDSATGGNAPQRFRLNSAAFGGTAFATGCHRLQPRGSIKAPSLVVSCGNMLRTAYASEPHSSAALRRSSRQSQSEAVALSGR